MGAGMDMGARMETIRLDESSNSRFREEQLSFFKRSFKRDRVELVARDLEILEFILDMKFAGGSEVFTKFFSRVGSHQESTSTKWAKKRLMQLERGGFLRSAIGIGVREKVYFATFKAFYAISTVNPERRFPKPTGGLDLRTFVHDRELLLLRMAYESRLGEIDWVSDRRLKQGFATDLGLSGVYVPDALVAIPAVGRVAIELEIAMKAQSRYRDKVSRYVRLIREGRDKPLGLRKVIFHVLRKPVFEVLKRECDIYQGMFEVILSPHLTGDSGGFR